jgi:hypothetical protein
MRRWILFLAAFPAGGCAALANKPATPAAELRDRNLEQITRRPEERYFLMVFGSERTIFQPQYTHSWATLVRATCQPGGGQPVVEGHTISWMPATLVIVPRRYEVEPGVNLDLTQTMRYVTESGEHVSMWGPYEVWHGFAHRFLTQKAFLESGGVGYQCVDSVGEAAREGTGNNCIHGITDMDPVYDRGRYPLAFYGISASNVLIRRLMKSPIFINPEATHDWIIPAGGLDEYPIRRRKYVGLADEYRPGGGGFDRGLPVVGPLAPGAGRGEPGLGPTPAGPPPAQKGTTTEAAKKP